MVGTAVEYEKKKANDGILYLGKKTREFAKSVGRQLSQTLSLTGLNPRFTGKNAYVNSKLRIRRKQLSLLNSLTYLHFRIPILWVPHDRHVHFTGYINRSASAGLFACYTAFFIVL